MNLHAAAVAGLCAALCTVAGGAQVVTPFDTLKARALLERSLPCLGCHTLGASGGRVGPDLATVRQRRTARVTPRRRGTAYEFVVSRDGEADEVLRVDGVVGGGHMEGGGTHGFVTRRDDGTVRFLSFDWSRHDRRWFCNTNSRAQRGWVSITPELRLADCGDWPPVRVLGDLERYANCQGCHASQLSVALDTTSHRYETKFTSLAINCES